ncbi:ephrin type-A receptor 4-B isoform X2 [Pseudoliparis swirei]|nr:ephrin type-A receptor 4-B isoform X2 [Pseudoliparis swirei]
MSGSVRPSLVLLGVWIWGSGSEVQHQAEDVEVFHSDKHTRLQWSSEPAREWTEVLLPLGGPRSAPVLQACGRSGTRTILSPWMERRDAHRLLMDVSFAQEEEASGQLGPLRVHLLDSNTATASLLDPESVLDLQTSKPFPSTFPPLADYLNRSRALSLGPVRRRGFRLALSYSGTCVLVTSIRLYYRRCPDTVARLASFKGTGAASGPVPGSCVEGAVAERPPERACGVEGRWGPLQGACTCAAGRQVQEDTCQVCWTGFYKPANESGGCRACPPNSRTRGEGSESCDCVEGFSRLHTDPDELGCTRSVPPVVSVVTPPLNVSEPHMTPPPPPSRRPLWLAVCASCGVLLLVIPVAVGVLRSDSSTLRSEQEVEMLPMNAAFTFRHPQQAEAAPQISNTVEGVVQLLEGLSGRLLDSLKEVLVERNQLTLGKELGKGEFGSVYEGVFTQDDGVDLKVAVKTMRVGIHSQEDLHEFLREAEIMKNFDHEHVVRLLGVTLQREQDSPLPLPLVILPYMKYGDLRRFLIATRYGDIPMSVPHQSLLRFMIDVAAGMNYLSTQGFLHRDLAARNCMLGDDLRVSVADFGLSKKIYSSNYYRQKAVTRVPVKWMAVESLSESVYTTKSDV